jgi:hypothetical protein
MRRLLASIVESMVPPSHNGRLFALASLLSSIGFAMYTIGAPVFFVRSSRLSVSEVGLGLSISAIVAIAGGIPIGHLADRVGPREVAIAIGLIEAAILSIVVFVNSFVTFVVLLSLLALCEQGAVVARGALVSGVMGAEGRIAISAYSRSMFNVGFTVGLAFTGVVLGIDRREAYVGLMWTNAALTAIACILFAFLPRVGRTGTATGLQRRWAAIRDYPYLVAALVVGAVSSADTVLSLGIPLWVVQHTHVPRALGAWLIALNSILVVILQVRVSRGISTIQRAGRAQRRAAVLAAVACLAIGSAALVGPVPAAISLAVAVLLLTLSELMSSAAGWVMRFNLAPSRAQGQYGGVFAVGSSLRSVVAPIVVLSLTSNFLVAGWVAIAGLFALIAIASTPISTWAGARSVARDRDAENSTPS